MLPAMGPFRPWSPSTRRSQSSPPQEQPRRNDQSAGQGDEHAHAQVRRATLHPLFVAQIEPGALGERFLCKPAPQTEPPDVGGDRP